MSVNLLPLAAVLLAVLLVTTSRRSKTFPPGPPGLPLIGNLHDLPLSRTWLRFSYFKNVHNLDILGLKVLGQPIIVLNSLECAIDLLNKRSGIYSDRPSLTLLWDIAGWKWSLNLIRYGNEFHTNRKAMNSFLNPSAVLSYRETLEREARLFAVRLVELAEKKRHSGSPANLGELTREIRRMTTAVSVMIGYGVDLHALQQEEYDAKVTLAEDGFLSVNNIPALGLHPLDLWPRLQVLPLRLFGLKLVHDARHRIGLGKRMRDDMWLFGMDRLGTDRDIFPSMVSVARESESEAYEQVLKTVAANVYFAASDTSVSNVDAFILAMIAYPEVQYKAQAEIDQLLHGERLPTFSDRSEMKYLEAVMREVLRWRPPAPLGAAPHHLTVNDSYRGFDLPKGSIVIFNAWQFLHDPKVWTDPEDFKPERFLEMDMTDDRNACRDPWKISFGFGRRICPGRHLVTESTFIAYAILLSVFEFSKPVDEDGKTIEPDLEFLPGFVSHPKPYECILRVRNENSLALLRAAIEFS